MRFDNVGAIISAMTVRQRVVALIAMVAAVAAFVSIMRMATQPSLALLYSGLDPAAAGEVVQALEQQGAAFEVRGGAIYVDAAQRDMLRMTLASEGRPSNGPAGYELLDTLTGFGTTSQMFDAAYWRAKEGELSRTISASPFVRSARVHISNANSRPFARDSNQRASVTVVPAGDGLPPEQAQALRFLVASAVAGLDAADVSVIDARQGRIIGGDAPSATDGADQRATELRRRAERLLEARVGPGNAVVEVTVEPVTDAEQIVERTIDPESRVLISTEVQETATAATDVRPADVTVASNVPDGEAGAGGGQSSSDTTETRERSNFEISETTRELVRTPGGIRRISVAVLVNEPAAAAEGAEAPATRSEEELAALRELVASAVGFSEARGDVITIQAMSFTAGLPVDLAVPGVIEQLVAGLDLMRLIQLATLALVALVLGLFVVRPILMRDPPPVDLPQLPGMDPLAIDAMRDPGAVPALPGMAGSPDATQRLVQAVGARQSDAVAVLRNWMQQDGGGA